MELTTQRGAARLFPWQCAERQAEPGFCCVPAAVCGRTPKGPGPQTRGESAPLGWSLKASDLLTVIVGGPQWHTLPPTSTHEGLLYL